MESTCAGDPSNRGQLQRWGQIFIPLVLGTTVALGPDGPPDLASYCVDGDLLHWREPGSEQHLLLRRSGADAPVPDTRLY